MPQKRANSCNGYLPMSSDELEIEIDRDNQTVAISVRSTSGNFVLELPLEGASVVSAALVRATDYSVPNDRTRWKISRATLEVSK